MTSPLEEAVTFSFCFKILQTENTADRTLTTFSSWMALEQEWGNTGRKNKMVELMLKNVTLTLSTYCVSEYANTVKSCEH